MTPERLRQILPRASASVIALNAGELGLDRAIQIHNPITPTLSDGMTKTEREFSYILESRKRRGEIKDWKFGDTKLRLAANKCWYHPDFRVLQLNERPLFIETKGKHVWDDSRVKFKVAREIHGEWADFEMWQKKGGQWTEVYPNK